MYKKYTALVLAAFLVATEANSLASKALPALRSDIDHDDSFMLSWGALLSGAVGAYRLAFHNRFSDERWTNWEGFGLSADVNEYVDNTIYMLVPFIQANGLDPMPLPDIEEGFEVRPVLITYSAWMRIHSGSMTGLVNVARSGDQMVHYFAKMLRVRVQLEFKDLQISYRYLIQVMNIGPTGGIIGTLNRFVITVDLLFDFNNDEIHLQEFSLSDIGRLSVRLTGNILYDWLATPVINIFLRIFDNIIMRVVESNISSAVQVAISNINVNLHDIIRRLESFN